MDLEISFCVLNIATGYQNISRLLPIQNWKGTRELVW